MRGAIAQLVTCDQVALLDGWQQSKGAQLEVHIAEQLGIERLPIAAAIERANRVRARPPMRGAGPSSR